MAKGKSTLASDLDLDTLKAPPGGAATQRFIHEQPSAKPVEAPAPSIVSEGLLKTRAIATTLYLLPADHKRLRHLCSERGVAAQTLLLDAIDMLFAQAGQPPVERWETRRKVR
jgi:hypothetical protein